MMLAEQPTLKEYRGRSSRKSRRSKGMEQGLSRSPSGCRSLGSTTLKSAMKQPRVHKTITYTHDADKEQIISQICNVKEDHAVNDVIMENLLSSGNKQLSDKLISEAQKAIVNASDRYWYKIEFKDSFPFTREAFGQWQYQKSTMMLNFEDCGITKVDSALYGVISWQTNITLPEKTDVDDICQVLKIVKDDPSVLDVRVSIPRAKDLVPMVDWNRACPRLKQPLRMAIACGWARNSSSGSSTSGSYKKMLIACLTLLKNAKRQHAGGSSGPSIEFSLSSKSSFRSSSRSSFGSAELRATSASSPREDDSKEIDTRAFGRNALQREETTLGGTTTAVEESDPFSSHGDSKNTSDEDVALAATEKATEEKRTNNTESVEAPVQQQQKQQQSRKCYWKRAVDPTTNNTYYFHRKTREVCWDKPQEMVELEMRR